LLVKPVLETVIPPVTHENETETLNLECTYVSNPIGTPSDVYWKHNGVTLSTGGDITITQSILYIGEFSSSVTSTLQVANIGRADGNTYECSATNSMGTTAHEYNVSICRTYNYLYFI